MGARFAAVIYGSVVTMEQDRLLIGRGHHGGICGAYEDYQRRLGDDASTPVNSCTTSETYVGFPLFGGGEHLMRHYITKGMTTGDVGVRELPTDDREPFYIDHNTPHVGGLFTAAKSDWEDFSRFASERGLHMTGKLLLVVDDE